MEGTFGSRLRAQREQQGVPLAEIAERTKIKLTLLEGLERDDVSHWPTGIFRRSFVRAYAQAIGLDGDAVVREFLELYPDPAEEDVNAILAVASREGRRPPTRLGYLISSAFNALPGRRRAPAPEANGSPGAPEPAGVPAPPSTHAVESGPHLQFATAVPELASDAAPELYEDAGHVASAFEWGRAAEPCALEAAGDPEEAVAARDVVLAEAAPVLFEEAAPEPVNGHDGPLPEWRDDWQPVAVDAAPPDTRSEVAAPPLREGRNDVPAAAHAMHVVPASEYGSAGMPVGDAPDYGTVAELCTRLARAVEPHDVVPVLEDFTRLVDAVGLIVWMWDPSTRTLGHALAHGYSHDVLSRLPRVCWETDNAIADAFRSAAIRVVHGSGASTGAIVAPIVAGPGCAGVLALELAEGRERREWVRGVAAIVAAQMAALFGCPDLAEAVVV